MNEPWQQTALISSDCTRCRGWLPTGNSSKLQQLLQQPRTPRQLLAKGISCALTRAALHTRRTLPHTVCLKARGILHRALCQSSRRAGSHRGKLSQLTQPLRQILLGRTSLRRPPPPASQALEPRCAWNGDNFRTRPQGNGLLAFSDERSSSSWELSDRALDPYTYARRAACAADGRGTQNRVRYTDARMPELRAPEREHFVERSGGQTARGTERRVLQRPTNLCYKCNQPGNFARDCRAPASREHALSGNERRRR
ncbi:hypothetical protein HPB50_010734 [Hyalomma asiaticum]|uniref:Uncharacterized protein n=1 Tax=Hyalomma asiaticum TaxID=266040 RepID=A0ACB7RZZ3_HYAAI|nr:hypothetical protein HPB50_010734 [Hyalomma asiaticum]